MSDEFENLSRAEIFQIAWKAKDKTADKDEIRKVFERFCQIYESEMPLPPELLEFFYDSIKRYLDGDNLEASFGLKRNRGQGKSKEDRHREVASKILELLLTGYSLACSVTELELKNIGLEESQLRKIWAKNKQNAFDACHIERDKKGWTEAEKERLTQIFKDEAWFKPST